jgi:hypothetical protein
MYLADTPGWMRPNRKIDSAGEIGTPGSTASFAVALSRDRRSPVMSASRVFAQM